MDLVVVLYLLHQLRKNLLHKFFVAPDYIGTLDNVETKRDAGGKLLANVADILDKSGSSGLSSNTGGGAVWKEVLNVNSSELANIGITGLQDGLYLVGTGNTGVAATMGSLGLGYLAICATSSLLMKVPKPGWKPAAMIEAEAKEQELKSKKKGKKKGKKKTTTMQEYVEIDDAMKTPQFWLLWTTFLSTATAGMGLMSCAKDVLAACFASSPAALAMGPSVFAATYVQALSAANLGFLFISR